MRTKSRRENLFRLPRCVALTLIAVTCVVALVGCRQQMADQPSYRPLQPAAFFSDKRSSRPIISGTVARGQLDDDVHLHTGRRAEMADMVDVPGMMAVHDAYAGMFRRFGLDPYVDSFPFPITKKVLERGQQQYNIFCAVCHDRTGGGNGIIVQRGFTPAPTFHQDRLREAKVGYFFQVITRGFGAMPDYSAQIRLKDRWAIIAYVRALQYSQNAPLEVVPVDRMSELAKEGS